MRSKNRRRQWIGLATACAVCLFALLGSTTARADLIDTFDPPNTAATSVQGNSAPGPAVLSGGPSGDYLRLINNGVNSQSNHYAYDLTDAGSYSTFNAQFDFRAFGSGASADGFSMLILPTSVYGVSGIGPGAYFAAEEPNITGVTAIGFDLWQNVNDVSLHVDGTERVNTAVNPAQVDLDADVFHRANVQIQQVDNGSYVTVQLTNDIYGAPGPTVTPVDTFVPGLMPYENRMQFSGRSGGANMNVDLDNIDVQYTDPFVPDPNMGRKTVQDWDPGTPNYTATQMGTAPGPTVVAPGVGDPTGNYLRLINDGVNSQNNSIAFNRIDEAGTFGTITADFDFRGISAGTPADGFSFVLAPTAQAGTSGPGVGGFDAEEPNIANTFAIGFDIYPGMNEVSIHNNGAVKRAFNLNTADIDLDSGVFNRAHVEITPAPGGSNLLVRLTPDVHGTPGTAVTAVNEFVPNLYPYESRAQFNGRSGGLNMTVDLDNINVEYANPMVVPSVSPKTLYQDFDSAGGTDYTLTQAGSSPGPIPVAGGPAGNFLRLLNNGVNSQRNDIAFDRAPDGGVSNTLKAEVDFRLDGHGSTPADGFSMVFLPTADYGRSGGGANPAPAEQPNVANALAVGFGVYPWGAMPNNVSVHFNNSQIANIPVDPNVLNLDSGQFHRAEVIARHAAGGGSNVTINLTPDIHGTPGTPVNVVTDLFVPGFRPYDYRMEFAGRTGGANMDADLDNIISGNAPYPQVGTSTVQDFEGGGGTEYKGHWFRDGSPPALLTEPGNTFLRLTDNQGSAENAVAFEKTFDGAAAAIDAQFAIRLGGNMAADGGSFVLLNTGAYDDIPNAGAWEEPNLTGTFGIGFDIYNNVSEVSLHWNGGVVANLDTTTLPGSPNLHDVPNVWLNAALSITYDAAGAYVTLTETNLGIPLYTNHPIPGMTPYEAQVVVGARTGGAVCDFDVDDVNVQYTAGGGVYVWDLPVTGNYTDGARWDIGISPSGADNAFIPHGQADSTNLVLSGDGSLTINGTGVLNESNALIIGNTGGQDYEVTVGPGGILSVGGGDSFIGRYGHGTLNVDGGMVTYGGALWVGDYPGGDGEVNQTDGVVNVNGWILGIAQNATATGSYNISGGTLNANGSYLLVGRVGPGHLTMDGASTAVNCQRLFVGEFAGSGGSSVTVNDGTLRVTAAEGIRVATDDDATMTQNGGIVDVDRRLHLGHAAGHTGTYNMNDGQLFVREHLVIGLAGEGIFNQTGGTVTQTGGGTYLGDQPTGVGTYNLSDGTLNANFIRVGQWAGSYGHFNQTGGVVTTADRLHVADAAGSQGLYEISDGQVNVGGYLVIGVAGTGTFTQTGGTVTQTGGGGVYAGDAGTAVGTYNLSGGTLNANFLRVAQSGGARGTFNLSGTGVINSAGDAIIGEYGYGELNVQGGTATIGGALYAGHLAGSSGAVTQTGGAVTVNGWILALSDHANATASYDISGGSLDVNGDYLIVGRRGVGHMTIGGAGTVVNAPRLFIGDMNADADGSTLTVNDGTLTTRNDFYVGVGGDGSLTQNGGTINANGGLFAVCNNANSVGTYDISGGELNVNGTYFVVGRYGQGHVTQTGGDVSANRLFIAELGGGENAGSTYTISGGSLDVSQDFRVAASHAATFKVITGAPTINVNELLTWSGRSTIAFDVASDGIGAINVANAGNIAGHLEMGIHGGAALTQDPIFLLIQANPLNGADFDTKEQSVFITGKVGNQYGAMLDPAQSKGTLTAAAAPGWSAFFTKAEQGWVEVDNINDANLVEILLQLDFMGAAPENDLAALIDFMTDAGLQVEAPTHSPFDLLVTFDPHAGTSTSYFEWDFGDFDPNVGVTGIGANIPEPATLSLLVLGGLGILARRRRNRR